MKYLENIFVVVMTIVFAPIYYLCYWYDRNTNGRL